MPPIRLLDNWSDSDEEERPLGVETDVLLGIPDGKIENEGDLIDAAVSRIGGLPVRISCTVPISMY
jgi:pre-rRNA-processing protein TSR4